VTRTALLCVTLCSGFLGLGLYLGFSTTVVYAQAASSEPKLHLIDVFTTRGRALVVAADSIERNDSIMRLRGNVEIKLRPLSPSEEMMVLRADAADYDRKTDQIVPRGRVRIAFERPR
jgi:lipopolysaccharide assembly outer membrane protein LptD (OstA)